MPLSIVLLFLFKHIYRQSDWGRWSQVSPTANTPQLEAAFKTHPGLKLDCPQCRTKLISRRLRRATLPMAAYTATWFKKHKSSCSDFWFFFNGIFAPNSHGCLESAYAHLSLPRPSFIPVFSCPWGGVPGQTGHAVPYCAVPGQHGHPHSSLLGCAGGTLTPHWPRLPLLCRWEANLFGPLLVHNPRV